MRHPDVVRSPRAAWPSMYDFDAERDSNVIEWVYVICRLRILLGNERIETAAARATCSRSQP